MSDFDLKEWLSEHSSKFERTKTELIFTHFNGQTSILLPRDRWRDGLLTVEIGELAPFYGDYFGASIGNSQLAFATNIIGGIDVSHAGRQIGCKGWRIRVGLFGRGGMDVCVCGQ
jgi:hypothetical protein